MGDRDSEKETKTQREGCRDLVRTRERDGDSEIKGNRDLERVDRIWREEAERVQVKGDPEAGEGIRDPKEGDIYL